MNPIIPNNISLDKVVIFSGGNTISTSNPHIISPLEQNYSTNDEKDTINFYFKLFDTLPLQTTIPTIDQDSLKYLQIDIFVLFGNEVIAEVDESFLTTQQIVENLNNIRRTSYRYVDQREIVSLDYNKIKNLLNIKVDQNNNQSYEINYSFVSFYNENLEKIKIIILPTLNIQQIANDFNLSVSDITSLLESSLIYENILIETIKENGQYSNKNFIINNKILEQTQKRLDSLLNLNSSFINDPQLKFKPSTNTSKYFSEIYISRKSDNTNVLFFNINTDLLIKEQTFFGLKNISTQESEKFSLNRNSLLLREFLNQSTIKLIRRKVQNISNNIVPLQEPELTYLENYTTRNINGLNYYIFEDDLLKNKSSNSSILYQYGVEFTLKDISINLISNYYFSAIEGITQIENYYKKINIPINTTTVVVNDSGIITTNKVTSGYYNLLTNTIENTDLSLPTREQLNSYLRSFYSLYGLLLILRNQDTANALQLENFINLLYWGNTTPETVANFIKVLNLFLEEVRELLQLQKIVIDQENFTYSSIIETNKFITHYFKNDFVKESFFYNQQINSIKYVPAKEEGSIPTYIIDNTTTRNNKKIILTNFVEGTKFFNTSYIENPTIPALITSNFSLVTKYYECLKLFNESNILVTNQKKSKYISSNIYGATYSSNLASLAEDKNCSVILGNVEVNVENQRLGNNRRTFGLDPAPAQGISIRESILNRPGFVNQENVTDTNLIYGESTQIENQTKFNNVEELLYKLFIGNLNTQDQIDNLIPKVEIQVYIGSSRILGSNNDKWTSSLFGRKGSYIARLTFVDDTELPNTRRTLPSGVQTTQNLEIKKYKEIINNILLTNKYFILNLR